LECTHAESHDLEDLRLAVVAADHPVAKAVEACKAQYLEAVPSGNQDRIPAALEFLDNGGKEWNMRRVVEIDPDLSIEARHCGGARYVHGFGIRA
jgi:hypothetical protein